MNLDSNPTPEQLRELLAPCDDRRGSHILWVKKNGDVEITRIPGYDPALGFEQTHPDMQMRYDTFLAGNEYVGPEAAQDDEWVSELFSSLMNGWSKAKGKPEVVNLGRF